MRNVVVGVSVVASFVFGGFVTAQLPSANVSWAAAPARSAGSGLITHATQVGDRQQLTVIDPETYAMAVYRVDTSKGEITLCSVRNIRHDLQLIEFQGTSPLPSALRDSIAPQKQN